MRNNLITKDFFGILWRVSAVSVLLKLVSTPVALINAKLLSDIVILATAGDSIGVLEKGVLILLILIVVKIFGMLTENAYQKSKSNAVHRCKMNLYKHCFTSPLHVLYHSSAGEANIILNRDFQTITEKLTETYPMLISGIITAIVYFVFICAQSSLIGYILLFMSMLQIVPPLISKRIYEKYDVADKNMEKQVSDCALEFCNGFSTIKMLNLKEWCLQRLKYLHDQWWGIANRLQATFRAKSALNTMISNILTYGTYAIVGLFILYGKIETKVGIEAIALSGGLYAAVNAVFQKITVLVVAKVAENRMMKFWSQVPSDQQMISADEDIRFMNVSCQFEEKKVFSRLNLCIPLKGITILKGENGSGKSTLMKMALGMIEYQAGDILVGGVHPNELSYDNFPKNIFFLSQKDAIYDLTPLELYQMLLGEKELKRVFSVLNHWGIDQKIHTRQISDLSGGERKKVFLSLAFAIDPKVLIMDEPTNSLDAKSCEILRQLIKERTKGTIMITHDEKLIAMGTTVYAVRGGGVYSATNNEKTDL